MKPPLRSQFIVIGLIVSSICLGQQYLFSLSGIDEFIENYSSEYGVNEVKYYQNELAELDSDSLRTILSEMETKISLWNLFSRAFIDKETLDFHSLMGLLSYNELIGRDERCTYVYYYGASLKKELGFYKSSIRDYTLAVKSDSSFHIEDYKIIGDRGETKFLLGDYYGAISDLSHAISSMRDDLENSKSSLYFHLTTRGRSYNLTEKYSHAIDDFNDNIELHPDCGECYYYRGLTYITIGEIEAGCVDLSKAGEHGYEEAYKRIEAYCQPK